MSIIFNDKRMILLRNCSSIVSIAKNWLTLKGIDEFFALSKTQLAFWQPFDIVYIISLNS